MSDPGLINGKIRLKKKTDEHAYVASKIEYNPTTMDVSIEYEKNEYMLSSVLNSLPDNVITINLNDYDYEWISNDSSYCLICHDDNYDDLYFCNQEVCDGVGDMSAAFHSNCLRESNIDHDTAYEIPNQSNINDWICPQHYEEESVNDENYPLNDDDIDDDIDLIDNNVNPLQILMDKQKNTGLNNNDINNDNIIMDKKRQINNDNINIVSQPRKKRKLNNYLENKRMNKDNENWIGIENDVNRVYPRHIICSNCISKGNTDCDGKRPCNKCWTQINNIYVGNDDFAHIPDDELDLKIHNEACDICFDRIPVYNELESDKVMKIWYKLHYTKEFNKIYEANKNMTDSFILSSQERPKIIQLRNNNDTNTKLENIDETKELKVKNDTNTNIISNDKLIELKLPFKQNEIVTIVPTYAKYECTKCNSLFADEKSYKMHIELAHEVMIVTEQESKNEWKILDQISFDKVLSFSCPYAGCLRGANTSNEIEDHILRHHDLTDPTKQPINKLKAKAKKIITNEDISKFNTYVEREFMYKTDRTGIEPVNQKEKDKIEEPLHEASATPNNNGNDQCITKCVNKIMNS